MGKVNLELSQKQYEKLVETVYLGTWMINSTRMELDDDFEEVREVVLAKYKEAGLEDRVVHQEEVDIYDLDVDYESKLLDTYVEEYDEFSFWDKLVEKLADKEMAERYGTSREKMTEEMMEARVQIEEKIEQKLEETGVTKLNFTDE
ncbi:hypothetical protein [Halobacillus sp. K22]|uniref:hypothetical protein n=1 Tax=Halobacillus sp. K22 TaxID=3457431 RepID=UPI003FCDE1D0